jgi:thymidylate kinase
MAKLNILIVGDRGSGKSTAAVLVRKILADSGFKVELTDEDAQTMMPGRFQQCLEALKGTDVRISCGNVHLQEKKGAGR